MKKWILRILGLLLIVVIGLVIYIEVNKEKLVGLAIDEANKSINGTITYKDSDVSIFTSFPNLGISLQDIKLDDAIMREPTPLLELEEVGFSINLISAIKNDIVINGFSMKNGLIYIANYADGSTNYDIAIESNSSTKSEGIDFDISKYNLENIGVIYKDEASASRYEVQELNTVGHLSYKDAFIDISNDFDGKILVSIAELLPSYTMDFDGKMSNVINPTMDNIKINDAEFRMNDLPISLNGELALGDFVDYKFDFNSPATEIKRLISLLPNFYKNQYASLIGQGTYVMSGNVNGSTKNEFPVYKVSLMAKNGSLKYKDLNAQIDKFGFSLLAENDNKSTSYSKLIINDIDIASGQNILAGSFTSRPDGIHHKVSSDLTTDINLADLAKSLILNDIKIEGSIKGLLKANASINTKSNEIRASDERFEVDLLAKNIIYKDERMAISLLESKVQGHKEKIDFSIQKLSYQDELDMNVKGYLNEPTKIVLEPNHVVKGAVEIDAGVINLDKLSGKESTGNTGVSMSVPKTEIDYVFQAKQITQGDYILNNIRANGNLKAIGSTLDFTVGEFNGTYLNGNGKLNNILAYGLNNDTLTGSLKVISDRLDLNKFMGLNEADELVDIESTEPIIPTNINLDIDYEASQIGFKNINITKSLGNISLKNQKVIFENKGEIFGGKISLTGVFDTDMATGYKLEMNLDLKELEFAKTAAGLTLFDKLLPIAKLLEGEYTASLNWSSELSKDYVPDLNSLTAYGLIQTKDGGIKSSLPIDSLIRKLNIIGTDKQPLKISDAKEYFIIEDGKVLVKEIELNKGDVDITMSGSHSFAQALDYEMYIDIPKDKIRATEVLNFIQDKLKFSNLLASAGDDVDVQIEAHMGGSILKPKFSIKGVNLKKGDIVENIETQIVNKVEEVKDSILTEIRDTIDGYINQGKDAIDSLNTKVDEIKTDVEEKIDSAKQVIIDEVDKEKEELKKEGEQILTDILTGNSDSTIIKIEDFFKDRQGKLDSLANKFPINKLFGGGKSN